jgi:hypothetical protein
MGGMLALAARGARRLRRPETRGFAHLALAGVVISLVFCYVDLGLSNGRVTIFLGTIAGVLGVLEQVDA